ncbi:MAG: cobalamin-dependent protein [Magnetococcales bacterium]|nr:cobalamin-dependent protein [Magnetococcales bacterium]
MKTRTIILVDLSYYHPGSTSIIAAPLSIAYVAAFLLKMLPDQFRVFLIKDPMQFLELANQEQPVICAFSNYIWNMNLQMEAARHIKKLHPRCVTVMGGPNFNFSEPEWMDAFARKYSCIDFFIEGEGESRFLNLACCGIAHGFDINAMKRANPAGVAFIHPQYGNYVNNSLAHTPETWNGLDEAFLDVKHGGLRDINDIPSPYLTGLLDPFLLNPDFSPIIETNRGCPYSCTFCNWGSMDKAKAKMFEMDRITRELDYIASKNVGQNNRFYIGDANFGLFPRDEEIALLLRDIHERYGFPNRLFFYTAKNSSERVLRIGDILKHMINTDLLTMSRQSMDDQVLANIKRSNIRMETFNSINQLAKQLGFEASV